MPAQYKKFHAKSLIYKAFFTFIWSTIREKSIEMSTEKSVAETLNGELPTWQ